MSTPDDSVTSPRPGAALAHLVGKALTHAHPDPGSEDAAEVRAITDAMVRLLIGTPLHSDGKLTIVSLAAEAGLRRNKLTHKHTGLKDLFYTLVKDRDPGAEPLSEAARARAAKQQQDLARVRAERDDLRTLTQQLARVVQVLEVESHRMKAANVALEEQLAARSGVPDLAHRRLSHS